MKRELEEGSKKSGREHIPQEGEHIEACVKASPEQRQEPIMCLSGSKEVESTNYLAR